MTNPNSSCYSYKVVIQMLSRIDRSIPNRIQASTLTVLEDTVSDLIVLGGGTKTWVLHVAIRAGISRRHNRSKLTLVLIPPALGNLVVPPLNQASISAAAARPSLQNVTLGSRQCDPVITHQIPQTIKDCPRRQSPAAKTPSTLVA